MCYQQQQNCETNQGNKHTEAGKQNTISEFVTQFSIPKSGGGGDDPIQTKNKTP